jgi:hypothetical protein
MKIVVLAYDSQPSWSGLVLRIRPSPGNFRKNLNRFRSLGRVLKLLLRTESAIVIATKRNPTQGEAIMANDDTNNAQAYQQLEPDPDLKSLDRLVGTWEISGGAHGTVTYEWMEGGFFLIQHVDLEQYGQRIKGIEIIGHERQFGAEPSEDIKSRFYSSTGDTLDYVYELEGDTLTIWGGERGSPAYYRGTFSDDTLSGAWHYPGGGGYEAISTKVE